MWRTVLYGVTKYNGPHADPDTDGFVIRTKVVELDSWNEDGESKDWDVVEYVQKTADNVNACAKKWTDIYDLKIMKKNLPDHADRFDRAGRWLCSGKEEEDRSMYFQSVPCSHF